MIREQLAGGRRRIRFDSMVGITNLFGYVLNDPVNLIDPSGLMNPAGCIAGASSLIALNIERAAQKAYNSTQDQCTKESEEDLKSIEDKIKDLKESLKHNCNIMSAPFSGPPRYAGEI